MTLGSAGKPNSHSSVRALMRGLEILRHVNAVGEARPGDIARALNIPRPTVYRLLETLEEAGYIAYSASAARVRVTRLAAALGDGYAPTTEITQVAGPILAEYAARVIWPMDLTIYRDASMVVQETTHARSPLSIERGMTGQRLPVLRTSGGRAYLTWCSDTERAAILGHLRRLADPDDLPFLDTRWLSQMIQETAARGLAIRDNGEFRPKTASIAVPIRSGGTVLGCVSLIWIQAAMSTRTALEDFGPQMLDISAKIAEALSDQSGRAASSSAISASTGTS